MAHARGETGNARVLAGPQHSDVPSSSPTIHEGGPALVGGQDGPGVAHRAEEILAAGISELEEPVS